MRRRIRIPSEVRPRGLPSLEWSSSPSIPNHMLSGMLTNANHHRRVLRSLTVGLLGLGGTLGSGWALGSVVLAGAATAVPNKCAPAQPTMPPSTGSQTPSGFPIQMTGVTLASASTANTLASAYYQFNDMTCSEYTHQYQFAPPNYYYYDCVGFTGYTTREADPQAWQSVVDTLHLRTGYVPTPLSFEGFFNSLVTTPQAGWQAVPGVQSI